MRHITLATCAMMAIAAPALAQQQPYNIQGTQLQKYLIRDYRDYAHGEMGQWDIKDSTPLQEQLKTAVDGYITPLPLSNVLYVQSTPAEMEAQRNRLLQWYEDKDVVQTMPQTLARAAASFDCWLQHEQSEPNADHNLQRCRSDFYAAAAQLPAEQKMVAVQKTSQRNVDVNALATVYFEFDKANLTSDTTNILDQLKKRLTTTYKGNVVIVGHADTAGPADYNIGLSQRRAKAVANYLGLPHNRYRIEVRGVGETDLAVKTPDNTPYAANRRVTVEVDADKKVYHTTTTLQPSSGNNGSDTGQ